jgi:AcrR family transcriptional regulator
MEDKEELTLPGERPAIRMTRRGERRCERLREVAAELFLARGYEGVSLDEIILQAGGSKANIYNHFGGKEGLFLAVIEDLMDDLTTPLRALDLSSYDFEEGLRVFGLEMLKTVLQARHLALYRLIIGESQRIPALVTLWSAHGPAVATGILTDFLARHQAAGQRGRLPPERAAALFHNMVVTNRLLIFGLDVPSTEEEAKHLVGEVILLFCHGYLG